ncbi:phage tail protein [Methylobacterium brachiatum]|uniref:phage tail protein n=1 Tax=Methylobacterium brachiatum TaxID=269660 RepID=UPI000EFD6D16|nr:phage tail protein [Methylobacterium brachiatum]AYO84048.1 hypothetical protein EBB05_18445 [Methylobacterium brachiatum]
MAIVLMSLGNNCFYVPMIDVESPGYETLSRDSSYSWVPQGRLNAPIAMQYVGPGQDIIVIEGRCFPHFFGGLATLEAIRQSAAAGKPQTLIRYHPAESADGTRVQGIAAQIVGEFVVTRVRQGEKHISGAGSAHQVDFSIELAAYGADTPLLSGGVAQGGTSSTVTTQNTQAQAAQSTPAPLNSSGAQGSYPPGGA